MSRRRRSGEYGFDGNMTGLLGMIAIIVALLPAAVLLALSGRAGAAAIAALVCALLHNIAARAGRLQAIGETARALAPGGRVAIADLAYTRTYARKLEALGFIEVKRRPLGWRFWRGPAFPATTLVTGTKPGARGLTLR